MDPQHIVPSATGADSTRDVLSTDPERWVDEHGDYLMRFAISRVRDAVVAEDLVQEAFIAALRGVERFKAKSSERTWLTGILKYKIIDHFRRSGRETVFTDLEFLQDEQGELFLHPLGGARLRRAPSSRGWGIFGDIPVRFSPVERPIDQKMSCHVY